MLLYQSESEVDMASNFRTFVGNAYPNLVQDIDELFDNHPDLESDRLFIDTLTSILIHGHQAFRRALPEVDVPQASRALLYLSNSSELSNIYRWMAAYKLLMEKKIHNFPAADYDINYKHGMNFLLRCAYAIYALTRQQASLNP
ncbi:hypothetical protein KKG46_04825 [Patescibacteria group bacterium]|nr:hypothetical protein [Patescibacteria group bacterium]